MERCYEFKECKDLNEYLDRYMNLQTSEEDIKESAYQYLYDESNDWIKEFDQYNTDDIQNAFEAGAKWVLIRKRQETREDLKIGGAIAALVLLIGVILGYIYLAPFDFSKLLSPSISGVITLVMGYCLATGFVNVMGNLIGRIITIIKRICFT